MCDSPFFVSGHTRSGIVTLIEAFFVLNWGKIFMKFIVSEEVFGRLENVCFGLVVAKGINNKGINVEVAKLLDESIKFIEDKFEGKKVKEAKEILPYREAFIKLGMNPNKFMSSIEAMAS